MKKLYLVGCIILVATLNLNSKDVAVEGLPKLLGGGYGMECTFSPIPSRQDLEYKNEIKLYIYTATKATVRVSVVGKGFEKSIVSIPNDFIEFTIPASIGQVYAKGDGEKPLPDSVFTKSAIHISADAPFTCYCSSGNQNRYSSGFLALPVPQLGKNYIISSHPDYSNNETEYFPGEATITAPYDKTKVFIIKNISEVPDSIIYLMNRGDVLLLSTTFYKRIWR